MVAIAKKKKLGDGVRSAPNEIPNNIQSVDPEDLILLESGGKAPALKPPGLSIFIADTMMNNNDTSLKKSGASGDREISIGVDTKNTNRVVISDVSGGPDATAALAVNRWRHNLDQRVDDQFTAGKQRAWLPLRSGC